MMEKGKIEFEKKDSEIVYSKAVKAGKRIYYLDVKKSRNNDMYLAITESKKKIIGNPEDGQVSYEKHKIFLYKEDFDEFAASLTDVIDFIKDKLDEPIVSRAEYIKRFDDVRAQENAAETEIVQEEAKGVKGFFDKFRR